MMKLGTPIGAGPKAATVRPGLRSVGEPSGLRRMGWVILLRSSITTSFAPRRFFFCLPNSPLAPTPFLPALPPTVVVPPPLPPELPVVVVPPLDPPLVDSPPVAAPLVDPPPVDPLP